MAPFQVALEAGDLDTLRRVPKSDGRSVARDAGSDRPAGLAADRYRSRRRVPVARGHANATAFSSASDALLK
ncbi:MAG: hypothetical protein WAN86_26100, partial [Hyphomicrobiaceae bacterium]